MHKTSEKYMSDNMISSYLHLHFGWCELGNDELNVSVCKPLNQVLQNPSPEEPLKNDAAIRLERFSNQTPKDQKGPKKDTVSFPIFNY